MFFVFDWWLLLLVLATVSSFFELYEPALLLELTFAEIWLNSSKYCKWFWRFNKTHQILYIHFRDVLVENGKRVLVWNKVLCPFNWSTVGHYSWTCLACFWQLSPIITRDSLSLLVIWHFNVGYFSTFNNGALILSGCTDTKETLCFLALLAIRSVQFCVNLECLLK